MANQRVLVLDVDQAHNEKIAFTFRETPGMEVEFFQSSDKLIDVLNNKSQQAETIKEAERAVELGLEMQKKVMDTLIKSEKQLIEKNAQLKLISKDETQKVNITTIENAIKTLEAQFTKCKGLKEKLEKFMITKEQALKDAKVAPPKKESQKVHLLLIDRSFLGNIPSNWIQQLREQITLDENKDVPIAVLGYNENIDYIRKTVEGGVVDYFVKPVDVLLFRHNTVKLSGKVLDSSQKVFDVKTRTEVEMLRMVSVLSISEFELTAETNFALTVNEICEFYANQFSEDKSGRLLGRCLECAPDPSNKAKFLSRFSLIGLAPFRLNEMRKWIRAQYILIKQKEKEQ